MFRLKLDVETAFKLFSSCLQSNFCRKPLIREPDRHKKKLSNLAKLQFLNDKIDQKTNFAKLPREK